MGRRTDRTEVTALASEMSGTPPRAQKRPRDPISGNPREIPWQSHEDDALRALVAPYLQSGRKVPWSQIIPQIPNRSIPQARNRLIRMRATPTMKADGRPPNKGLRCGQPYKGHTCYMRIRGDPDPGQGRGDPDPGQGSSSQDSMVTEELEEFMRTLPEEDGVWEDPTSREWSFEELEEVMQTLPEEDGVWEDPTSREWSFEELEEFM